MIEPMKQIWKRWKRLAHGLVSAQNAVLLFLVFVFGVLPASLVVRLTGKRLLDRDKPPSMPASHWSPLPPVRYDAESAQRPW